MSVTDAKVAGPPHAAATADPRRWAALTVTLVAAFMDVVDVTVVLIAAPTITAHFKSGYAAIQWVVAAYSLALGLVLITAGRLGDTLGRKRTFLTGVSIFVLASVVCALAPTVGVLIVARAMQGIGAGLMIPQILATVQVSFPPQERPKAYGMYGAMTGLGSAAAPIIGGLLVGNDVFGMSWRSVFWINVPVGLVTLAAAAVLLRESRAPQRPRLDLAGVVVATSGLLLLLYPLTLGAELGWPVWAFAMMAASIPVLAMFVRSQARRAGNGDPLLPVSLFRLWSFTRGLVVAVLLFSTITAIFLVLTIQLQTGHGFSALKVGLTFMAWPVGLMITSGIAIKLAASMGRKLITIGTTLLTAAILTLIIAIRLAGDGLSPWHLVPGLVLGGLGFGLVAPIAVDIVLSAVPWHEAGAASGITNTGIYIGMAAGAATIGALFTTFLHGNGNFDLATANSLWYAVAAFAAAFALSFTLPAQIRSQS